MAEGIAKVQPVAHAQVEVIGRLRARREQFEDPPRHLQLSPEQRARDDTGSDPRAP